MTRGTGGDRARPKPAEDIGARSAMSPGVSAGWPSPYLWASFCKLVCAGHRACSKVRTKGVYGGFVTQNVASLDRFLATVILVGPNSL